MRYDGFWNEILIDWTQILNEEPESEINVRQQILWYNSHICINNEPIMFESMYSVGCNTISDIVNENGKFHNFEKIKNICPRLNFLCYRSLIAAIPKEWKSILKHKTKTEQENKEFKISNFINAQKPVRVWYSKLCKNESLMQTKLVRLNKELNCQFEINDLVYLIRNINITTISVKLQSFQYRCITCSLITNIQLKHSKMRPDDLCTFCARERETLLHLFYNCEKIKPIWTYVCNKFQIKNLNYKNVWCNTFSNRPKDSKNCIALIVKHYIYRTRCLDQRLSPKSCESYIDNYIAIEEDIAKTKNKLHVHEAKWQN